MNQLSAKLQLLTQNFRNHDKYYQEYLGQTLNDQRVDSGQDSSLLLSSIHSNHHWNQAAHRNKKKIKLHCQSKAWDQRHRSRGQQRYKKKICLVKIRPLLQKNINIIKLQPKPLKKSSKLLQPHQLKSQHQNDMSLSKQNLNNSELKCPEGPRRFSLSYSASTLQKQPSWDIASVKSKTINFSVDKNLSVLTQSNSKHFQNNQTRVYNNKKSIITKMQCLLYPYTQSIKIDLLDNKKINKTQKSTSMIKSIKSTQKHLSLNQSSTYLSNLNLNIVQNQQPNQSIQKTLQKISQYKFVQEYMSKLQIEDYLRGLQIRKQPECKWALLLVDRVFKKMRSDPTFENLVAKPDC